MPVRQFFCLRIVLLVMGMAAFGPVLAHAAGTAKKTHIHSGSVLPVPPQPFAGKIGADIASSTPVFPKPVKAPDGAPNVVLILTDDVGFSAVSTFGGLIPTPHLDRLAARGLKYNMFHTTAMCSPTRASLLTGRNHHAVGSGTIIDLSTGFPGYWSIIPRSAATVAEVLRYNGYNTAFFGKHHNVPASQGSAAGPFDLWPTGLGFEYFYGFVGGETNQWEPLLYRGTSRVDLSHKDHDYILDRDLADDAIHWIHNQKAAAPDKPFFIYYATGTGHAPVQAPAEWIKKFRGKFDMGWDKAREDIFQRQKEMGVIPKNAVLTPRHDVLPAWDSLSSDQKRINARLMEAFAGMMAFQDAQIGRIFDELERMGELDNTLVLFIEGDNGASSEGSVAGMSNSMAVQINRAEESTGWMLEILDELGGPSTHAHYPSAWAWATNTPFQWVKQVASHLGGTRNGLVVSWPDRIKATGELRTQFAHVIDIMPTILEAIGIEQPKIVNGVEQQRVDGISIAYTFDEASAPGRRQTQYFEMLGNRAIYHDGWMASTTPIRAPWDFSWKRKSGASTEYDWELYDLRNDYSQAHNLADKNPQKLKEMQALWMREAKRNNVLPIDDSVQERLGLETRDLAMRELTYVYWGGDISLAPSVAPPLAGRSFSIEAEVVLPKEKAQGVILATGGKFAGWSFFLKDGKPMVHHAFTQQPKDQFRIAAMRPLPSGPVSLKFDFNYDGGGAGKGGTMRISANGKEVASGRIERTIIWTGVGESLDIGMDTLDPVTLDYQGKDRFNGEIRKVELKLSKVSTAPAANP